MNIVAQILPYIQIILSILLIVVILLQQSSAGVGGAFGGGDFSVSHSKRGFEKVLFFSTIIIAILFTVSSILAVLI